MQLRGEKIQPLRLTPRPTLFRGSSQSDAYGLAPPLLDVTGHAYRELPQRPIMPESGRDQRDIEEVAMLRSRRLPVDSLTLTIGIS